MVLQGGVYWLLRRILQDVKMVVYLLLGRSLHDAARWSLLVATEKSTGCHMSETIGCYGCWGEVYKMICCGVY
jgi:hypothetical protein